MILYIITVVENSPSMLGVLQRCPALRSRDPKKTHTLDIFGDALHAIGTERCIYTRRKTIKGGSVEG